jgi:GT2 family glycosyltransferase
MKHAGYKSVFLPDSSIIHFFGHSTKQRVQKQVVNELLLERYRGMFYFFQKHYGFIKLLALRLIVAEGFALRLALSYIKRLTPLRVGPFPLDETIYMRKILMLVFESNFDWRRKP